MYRIQLRLFVVLGVALVLSGCQEDEPGVPPLPPQGALQITASGLAESVAGVLYEVECADGTTVSQYVPVEEEGLPDHIDATLAGQPFSDLFIMLPPGTCTVTATAMLAEGKPAEGCEPATEEVVIKPDQTTEVVLVIVCKPKPTGGLDVVAVITDGPSIVDVIYEPSKFVLKCQELTVTVDADGGIGPLTYEFEVVGSPAGAIYTVSSVGPVLTFSAETTGEYTIQVTVDDGATQSTMTFPIHVSEDPDVEHCDEACCVYKDGVVGWSTSAECKNAGGTVTAPEKCQADVCCETPQGMQVVPAAECPHGAIQPMEACEPQEQACCKGPEGLLILADVGKCVELGGQIVALEICTQEVCCKLETVQTVPAVDCPAGQMLPPEGCEPVEICCRIGDEFFPMTADQCKEKGGELAALESCKDEVCCELPDGTLQTLGTDDSKKQKGIPVSPDLCTEVCCLPKGLQTPVLLPLGDCKDAGGQILPDEKCQNLVHVWQADYTLDSTAPCQDTPYLVVPSSAANKLAVYDLATLVPLTTSPFPTCANPSRIMMDANTDVYATCRSDGKVFKHTRDGVLIWGTQLPTCATARGVAMSGNGRLFAGCSDTGGMVYELDPATGAVLGSVSIGSYRVYGIAVDMDGLFVTAYFDGKVARIQLGGALDFTLDWLVALPQGYGISADQLGKVWLGGSSLRALSTADGTQTDNVTTGEFITGVMVGLDGNIYGAAPYSDRVFRYDPLAATSTWLNLDTGADWDHGLTLDAQNNVYTINRNSSSLTKVTPANVATGFGGGILSSPYGYNGDMTGLTTSCLAGTTDTWLSTPIDSGSPTCVWQTISWTQTTPPGSGVAVYTSIDGGATWTQATNGQVLGVTGQILQVKAILSATMVGNEPTLTNVTVVYAP